MAFGTAGPKLEALAAALLECVGLLRPQRRVFISYRRVESANAALQLHEALGSRGFDVFLDTYDVRPAEDFQAIVWHRLCDSDVMVMLDTPGYFGSRWTAAEIGRAEEDRRFGRCLARSPTGARQPVTRANFSAEYRLAGP
jgi:hypothetical protein